MFFKFELSILTQNILKHFIVKKLEKLVEKSLSTSKMSFVKAGDTCTGGGSNNYAQPHLCRSIITTGSSDSVDSNGFTSYQNKIVSYHEWNNYCGQISELA